MQFNNNGYQDIYLTVFDRNRAQETIVVDGYLLRKNGNVLGVNNVNVDGDGNYSIRWQGNYAGGGPIPPGEVVTSDGGWTFSF